MFVYTIQPLSNRFDKRLYRVYSRLSIRFDKHGLTTGWTNSGCSFKHGCQTVFVKPVVQPGLTTGWTNSLFVQHGCQTGCQTRLTTGLTTKTGLTTGWMFVYTIQPVVKPVVQPVWQPVVSCKRGFTQQAMGQAVSGSLASRLSGSYGSCTTRIIGHTRRG